MIVGRKLIAAPKTAIAKPINERQVGSRHFGSVVEANVDARTEGSLRIQDEHEESRVEIHEASSTKQEITEEKLSGELETKGAETTTSGNT